MDKLALLERVNSGEYDKDRLIGWITSMPGSIIPKPKPNSFKPGDVLRHPIFHHPYVLLEKNEDSWICGLLTTDADCAEILEKCNSRFYRESYFTKVIFTESDTRGMFHGVFENKTQLTRVLKSLKTTFK